MSKAQPVLLAVGGDVLAITAGTIVRSGAAGTLTATYTLNLDGNQYWNPINNNATSNQGYWVNPNGNAANYECSATLTAGSISTGDTTGAWLALSSSRSWTQTSAVAGIFIGTISVSIRRAGVGSALKTGSITLEVDHS